MRQCDARALRDQAAPDLDPRRLGPQLVVARGAVHEHDSLRRDCRRGLIVHRMRLQAELRRPLQRVAQRTRRELARTVQRMHARRDADRMVDQPARRRLVAGAFGAVGETIACPARREPRDAPDQRRLGQPLQVEHRVVTFVAQPVAKRAPLGTHAGAPPASGPAPQRALDRAIDAGDAPHQRCEPRLDDPVDRGLRQRRADVVDNRHRMHHIAQRRELDDQDTHVVSGPYCGGGSGDALDVVVNAPRPRRARRA